MMSYWAVLSRQLPTRKEAYAFRMLMVGNGILYHKMKIIKVKGFYRVIRRIHESELDDPLLGNKDTIAQYRLWLAKQTRCVEKWLEKPKRRKK